MVRSLVAEFGGWNVGAYMTVVKQGGNSLSPLVAGDHGVAFYGPNIQWQAGNRFSLSPYSNYVPSNSDRILFADSVSGVGQVTPAGFAKYTPYYMVNLGGVQFDLSASPGGSPAPITEFIQWQRRLLYRRNQTPFEWKHFRDRFSDELQHRSGGNVELCDRHRRPVRSQDNFGYQ